MSSLGRKGGLRPLPKKPKLDAIRNEINVTPLVDVVLVLLIIFMVITPLMARGKDVPLPETSYHSDEKDKLQPVISVDKNETVWLSGASAQGKQELTEMGKLGDPELGKKLKAEITRFWEVAKTDEARGRVFLKVDNKLSYGRIYPLLMTLNEDVELSSIDLGTAERRKGK